RRFGFGWDHLVIMIRRPALFGVGPGTFWRGWSGKHLSAPSLVIKLPWLEAAGGAKHYNPRALLVLRCRHHLFLAQLKRDAFALVGDTTKMQRAPVDDDLPAAYPEKAAEVDDGGAHRPLAIDDHIHDAPHVFVSGTADVASEYTMGFGGT